MKKRSKINAARARRKAAAAIERVMVTIPGGMENEEVEALMERIDRWRGQGGGVLRLPDVPGLRVAAWDEKGRTIEIDTQAEREQAETLLMLRRSVERLQAQAESFRVEMHGLSHALDLQRAHCRRWERKALGMFSTALAGLAAALGWMACVLWR